MDISKLKVFKFILAFVVMFYADIASTQDCKCAQIFSEIKGLVERNYAGWNDKVTTDNLKKYEKWSKQFELKTGKIKSDSSCYVVLKEWISFFKDDHLAVRYIKPKKAESQNTTAKVPLEILSTDLTETSAYDYLGSDQVKDTIEGIYESTSYKLAVKAVKENLFYATILSTSNENWNVGEVKLIIQKEGNNYKGTFFEGDKSGSEQVEVQLADNILDFDFVFFEKIFPRPTKKRDITEYEISKDRYAPSLSFPEKDLVVFKFPSFENNSYEQLEYLLKKYDSKLKQTPYMMIDLRGNSGGDYKVGMQLMKYIYSGPTLEYKSEMRMTEENFSMWYNSYVKSIYESLDSTTQKEYDDYFSTMKLSMGKMFNLSGAKIDTIVFDSILPFPRKIGVVIDSNTVSSGELFTMIVRQSDKVTVYGSNSGGMMDYGNVVQYKTSCAAFRLRLPIDRQLWLDDGISVDKEGLIPGVMISNALGDWNSAIYNDLKSKDQQH